MARTKSDLRKQIADRDAEISALKSHKDDQERDTISRFNEAKLEISKLQAEKVAIAEAKQKCELEIYTLKEKQDTAAAEVLASQKQLKLEMLDMKEEVDKARSDAIRQGDLCKKLEEEKQALSTALQHSELTVQAQPSQVVVKHTK